MHGNHQQSYRVGVWVNPVPELGSFTYLAKTFLGPLSAARCVILCPSLRVNGTSETKSRHDHQARFLNITHDLGWLQGLSHIHGRLPRIIKMSSNQVTG